MGNLSFQVCRQVDDVNGIERTFLWADTTAYAQALGDESDFRLGRDFDAEFASSNDWA